MIVHTMEQRSPEWYEIRKGKVSGTSAKGLFTPTDTLLIELVSEITEDYNFEQSFISFDMQRGIDLEPEARAELSRAVFVEFEEVGFLQSTAIPLLGISPDGISADHTVQCEVKCPGAKKHMEILLANEIPNDYTHQLIHAFVVNEKLERLFFASYRAESHVCPLWTKELTRESMVDLGTKAKPNIKKVSEWVEIALIAGEKLNKDVQNALTKLKEQYETTK